MLKHKKTEKFQCQLSSRLPYTLMYIGYIAPCRKQRSSLANFRVNFFKNQNRKFKMKKKKPFACAICLKTFAVASVLGDHVQQCLDTSKKASIPQSEKVTKKSEDKKMGDGNSRSKSKRLRNINEKNIAEGSSSCTETTKEAYEGNFAESRPKRSKRNQKVEPIDAIETKMTKSTFTCGVCSKEFAQSNHLKNHERTHNKNSVEARDAINRKEKIELDVVSDPVHFAANHECDICHKSFKRLVHLKKHLKSSACNHMEPSENDDSFEHDLSKALEDEDDVLSDFKPDDDSDDQNWEDTLSSTNLRVSYANQRQSKNCDGNEKSSIGIDVLEKKSFECNCGKKFQSQRTLNRHQNNTCTKNQTFQDKDSSESKQNMVDVIRKAHSDKSITKLGEKCEMCNKNRVKKTFDKSKRKSFRNSMQKGIICQCLEQPPADVSKEVDLIPDLDHSDDKVLANVVPPPQEEPVREDPRPKCSFCQKPMREEPDEKSKRFSFQNAFLNAFACSCNIDFTNLSFKDQVSDVDHSMSGSILLLQDDGPQKVAQVLLANESFENETTKSFLNDDGRDLGEQDNQILKEKSINIENEVNIKKCTKKSMAMKCKEDKGSLSNQSEMRSFENTIPSLMTSQGLNSIDQVPGEFQLVTAANRRDSFQDAFLSFLNQK